MESSNQSKPDSADQQEFLSVFLASEREILRYVSALVPAQHDAREIVQQTAVLLWEKFDQYDRDRPFTPWACRFALNVTRQWMARHSRWKNLLDAGLAEELASRRDELRPEFDARLAHLKACLDRIPEKHRELVDGYYFQQHDIDAVAGRAGRSAEAVYKALQRVRKRLRECIERSIETGAIT